MEKGKWNMGAQTSGNLTSKSLTYTQPDKALLLKNHIALVGSSDRLKKSHYGPEIDSYDEVVRLNNAPTKSFETLINTKYVRAAKLIKQVDYLPKTHILHKKLQVIRAAVLGDGTDSFFQSLSDADQSRAKTLIQLIDKQLNKPRRPEVIRVAPPPIQSVNPNDAVKDSSLSAKKVLYTSNLDTLMAERQKNQDNKLTEILEEIGEKLGAVNEKLPKNLLSAIGKIQSSVTTAAKIIRKEKDED